jgi:hypothetical protein
VAELSLHGRPTQSIYQLLGNHENDMTYALGWSLARCDSFLNILLDSEGITSVEPEKTIIRLQQQEHDGGVSDIEIESPGSYFVLVEAKRGWVLPAKEQLELYQRRHSVEARGPGAKLILVITECSPEYASHRLSTTEIKGVPVRHVSWREVQERAVEARSTGGYFEKRMLDEFIGYLRELLGMQRQESAWTYVVSLGAGVEPGWGVSWIDIVAQRRMYFHPVGAGWPKEPVNYLAVRYKGELQSIHHVDSFEVVEELHTRIQEIPPEQWTPHFLYRLGQPLRPAHRVPSGRLYRAARVWCLLDTLFTAPTISEAVALTKQRLSESSL